MVAAFVRTIVMMCLIVLPGMTSSAAHGAQAPPSAVNVLFDSLKKHAFESSPDIRQAEITASQKNAAIFNSWARWLPRADLQLSRSQERNYSIITSGALGTAFFGFTPATLSLSSWMLNVTLPIYRRSVHLGILQSYAESDYFDREAEARRSELDWRVRSLLGNYLVQLYKIAALNRSVEIARANLKETKLRFNLGQRTAVDIFRADANVLSLESKLLTYEQEKTAAEGAILEYVGLSRGQFRTELNALGWDEPLEETEISPVFHHFTDLAPLLKGLESYLDERLDLESVRDRLGSRLALAGPAYRSSLAAENVSTVQARALMAQEWPELLFQASWSKQSPGWSEAFAPGQQSHSLAVVLNIPIFTGGSTFSTYYQKKYAEESATLKRDRDILRLKHDLEEQFIQIQALRKAHLSQSLSRNRNQELVRLTLKSYQLGKATFLELLTSQNDLLESKLALIQTKNNLAVTLRKFAWSLGVPIL